MPGDHAALASVGAVVKYAETVERENTQRYSVLAIVLSSVYSQLGTEEVGSRSQDPEHCLSLLLRL